MCGIHRAQMGGGCSWRRIQGKLDIIGAGCADEKLARARVAAWKNMSDPGRTQFAWPEPGLPRPEASDTDPYDLPAPPADAPPLETFSLVVLEPHEVDYLSLKGNIRKSFVRSDSPDGGAWSATEVNP